MPARNPKQVRLSVSLTTDLDDRVNRIADRIGQNKGVTLAILVAAGLQDLESAFLGARPEILAEAARLYDQQRKVDVQSAMGVQQGDGVESVPVE